MGKLSLAPIEDDRVRLRLLEAADLPLTLAWRNQEDIRRWFIDSQIISPDDHSRWFEAYRQREDDFIFIIEDLQWDHHPVGQVSIYHVDRAQARAEFGRLMIGEASVAGQGLAFAATRLALQIAFDDLGMQEVYLEVLPDNRRAIDLYHAAGFQTSGVEPELLRMSLRAADFQRV